MSILMMFDIIASVEDVEPYQIEDYGFDIIASRFSGIIDKQYINTEPYQCRLTKNSEDGWPPVDPDIDAGFNIGSYNSATWCYTGRGYLAFDLTDISVVPKTAKILLTPWTEPKPSKGSAISIRPYISNFGSELSSADWGPLDEPAGESVSGPFLSETPCEFVIDPTKLTPGAINYFELAITDEVTEPPEDSGEWSIQFHSFYPESGPTIPTLRLEI